MLHTKISFADATPTKVKINNIFEHKITNIFLSINFNIITCVLGAQKNCLIEMVLLTMFWLRNKKIDF